jgi:ATP-dependent Clp protease adaptor protein ClpS
MNAQTEQTPGIKERDRVREKEPHLYGVVLFNDDFTTMEFVVTILVQVFFKSQAEAEALMLQVHHSDKAVVGIYSYDVATSKARKATKMAREAGFPLRLTVEPEDE